jgi:fructose-1,6-bisphosphatase/inositol monophosphatase family enzyme
MTSDCKGDRGVDLQLVKKWIRDAGELALELRAAANISIKSDNTIVTDVDHAVENWLLHKIAEHYPTHSILTEESDAQAHDSKYLWIIDPIDGTRAFASGLPF